MMEPGTCGFLLRLESIGWSYSASAAQPYLAQITMPLTPSSSGSAVIGIPTSGGTTAGVSGTGACATVANVVGGSWAGSFKCTGTTGAATVTITFGLVAPLGCVCTANDLTTRANLLQQTSQASSSCVLTATSITQNDVFTFTGVAY